MPDAKGFSVNRVACLPISDRPGVQAIEADAELKAALMRDDLASLPPFHGVPITIKECFALEGMPQTSGIVHRVGIVVRLSCRLGAAVKRGGCRVQTMACHRRQRRFLVQKGGVDVA